MYTKIKGGTVYDPINNCNGVVKDLLIWNGKIVEQIPQSATAGQIIDATGQIVMPGGIDIHTHIGGGKNNIARLMLAEDSEAHPVCRKGELRSGSGRIAPSTFITGYEYARLGYTMGFEPAVLPSNARQAHMEMADTPLLDTGGYLVLGNNEHLLQMLSKKEDPKKIRDFVAWMIEATQCIAVKAVNPGGISAFKFNQRALDVDEQNRHYGITPGQIVRALSDALTELNIPHPLHVHCSNLGVPGNATSTLETIKATDGRPIHLAHVQFHSYGKQGKKKFSSAARMIAEYVNAHPEVSVDVGHIMFGQTVTISADIMHQYRNKKFASPRKTAYVDIECEEGCGVVPFRYESRQFANALQWAVGLELFLLIKNPWQVFLTTDHPNGASFTTYPHLIRLLMDRSYRNDMLSRLNPLAVRQCELGELNREYSLNDIAVISRAGPAKSLGLADRGHLGPGAVADVAVYQPNGNWEEVFRNASLVIKDGETVVKNGEVVKIVSGRTHTARAEYDSSIEQSIAYLFNNYRLPRFSNFGISDDEMSNHIGSDVVRNPCRRAADS